MTRLAYRAISLAVAAVAACRPLPAASEPPRGSSAPEYMAYVGELEKAYDYDSYRATPPARRYDTEFFREVGKLLAPERYLSKSNLIFSHDKDYLLAMRQRAAILIVQREKWVPMVPFLLHYLDYAPNLLAATPMASFGRHFRGERWQYPSLAAEAILSFGSEALPALQNAAVDKRLKPELRLASLALTVQIDRKQGEDLGRRLQGDGFLDPDRLSGVLEGKITAADIAQSLAYTPKPKPH